LQLTGTIAEPPNGAELTLNTVVGELTVLLPQLMEEKQNQLLQQLLAMFQTQKPITITVQPGNPPTQILLLLPTTSGGTTASANANLLAQMAAQVKPLQIVPGSALPAVVLPPNISLATTPSPLPGQIQVQAPNIFPQSYAPPASYNVPLPGVPLPDPAAVAPTLIPNVNVIPALPERVISGEMAVQNLLQPNPTAETTSSPPPLQIPFPGAPTVIITSQTSPQISVPLPPAPGMPLPPVSGPLATPAENVSAEPLPLQPGNEAIIRVVTIVPPNSPLPAPQAPDQIAATVVASGPNNEPIIKAGDTTFYVRQSAPLPVGTNLLVTITPVKALPVMPLSSPDARNILNFQQIMNAIAQVSPQLAQQVAAASIPQPNAALPATLLFLMSAFKQGSVRSWLGDDAADALTHYGKAELISKLTQELESFAQPVREPVVGEWQSYPIPFINQGQMQILNFHVHGDHGKGQGKDEAVGKARASYVRFLIDLRLSRLGPMQFDGFIRQKQLDLVIRSEQVLPEGLHKELRGLYAKTMGVIDYMGTLNFQVGRQNWLNVQKTASKAVVT
jgi:hypothetical protein